MTAAPISDALSDPIEITARAWHQALNAATPHHVCIRHALHVRPRRPHWPDDTAGKGHPR